MRILGVADERKKALSIWQPWAWLIVQGHKDIENRSWPTQFRGRFCVHASRHFDSENWPELRKIIEKLGARVPRVFDFGALVGEVDIVDCVTESTSLWFGGPFGFVLANPMTFLKPIPCRGRLGFFEV